MSQPLACGWMAGWMAILIPASGIWKSEVKGRASQGCTSVGGRLLLPPPLPRRPGVCVQGLLGGTSPSPHPHPCRLVRNQKRLHPAARGNGGRPLDFRLRSEST